MQQWEREIIRILAFRCARREQAERSMLRREQDMLEMSRSHDALTDELEAKLIALADAWDNEAEALSDNIGELRYCSGRRHSSSELRVLLKGGA